MDATIVSAMAAVLGSLVGGSATVATAWVTQRTLSKRELIGAEIRKREMLYGEFISASSKLVVDSFERTLDKPEKLLSVYELLNRIRLSASDAVLAEAEQILKRITEQYFSPNLSVEELRAHSVGRRGRSTKVLRRGLPRGAQIDARDGVAVQPRQVISDEHASGVLNISIVERRSERRLILEGKLLTPWVSELRTACEKAEAIFKTANS